jgi:hypothetical protein
MSHPLALTDQQYAAVCQACEPLLPADRDGFLCAFANALRGETRDRRRHEHERAEAEDEKGFKTLLNDGLVYKVEELPKKRPSPRQLFKQWLVSNSSVLSESRSTMSAT